jgi:protein SCO1/2
MTMMRSGASTIGLLAAALVAAGGVWLAWSGGERAQPADFDRAAVLALPGQFPRTADFDFVPPEPGSYALPPIKPAAEGVLLDHTGTRVDLGALLRGRISLVSFVYLTCADVNGCPLAMSLLYGIEHASRTAPLLRRYAQLVTISFDPKRDPPAALAALAELRRSDAAAGRVMDWHFLTGTSEEDLKPLLAGFGQVVERGADLGRINHTLRLFLVDADGRIRNIYGLGTMDPRLLMSDIATLLLEQAGAR